MRNEIPKEIKASALDKRHVKPPVKRRRRVDKNAFATEDQLNRLEKYTQEWLANSKAETKEWIANLKAETKEWKLELKEQIAASEKATREQIVISEKTTRELIVISEKTTREMIAATDKSLREQMVAMEKSLGLAIKAGMNEVAHKCMVWTVGFVISFSGLLFLTAKLFAKSIF